MSESTAVEDRAADLKILVELQKLDLRGHELEGIVDDLPEAVARLEASLDSEQALVDDAERGVEESAHQSRLLEGEVSDLNEKLVKYKTQLMEVKTNEAYQAMVHEIDFVKQAISAKEDEILGQMMEMDELKERGSVVEGRFKERKREVAANCAELEKRAVEAQSELDSIGPQREEVQQQVAGDLLNQYNRIASARGGMALVPVEGESCQACHVRLRPQVIAMVKAGRGIQPCENCSRILYYPE